MGKHKYHHITIPEDPPKGPSFIWILIMFGVFWPVGLFLLLQRTKREWTRKRYRDFRRYINIIGNRNSVNIRDLAIRMGKAFSDVISDLQAMIDQGFMGENAYIDRSSQTLILDESIIETEFVNPTINVFVNSENSDPAKEKKSSQKEEPIKEEKNAKKPVRKVADSEDFEDKLREIRRLNDEIDNAHVSERIDRIGELTASISRVVRQNPDRADEVRKFMNYYLPTTFKLLKSYSLMEKQSYQGENIQASRKKIEDILDTLIHAFEQQQDRLFQSEALNVEADISVLETMMASDGLIEPEGGIRLKAGGR